MGKSAPGRRCFAPASTRRLILWRLRSAFVVAAQQPTEYFDMGIFLAFFVVVSLVCLILLVKIKLKQRRSQVRPPRPLPAGGGGAHLVVCFALRRAP